MKTKHDNFVSIPSTELDRVNGGWVPIALAAAGLVVTGAGMLWTAGHSKGMADRAAERAGTK